MASGSSAISVSDRVFNPSSFVCYGFHGQESLRKELEVLRENSLSLKYDLIFGKFTIPKLKVQAMEQILLTQIYKGWMPDVTERTDDLGNVIMRLKCIEKLYSSRIKEVEETLSKSIQENLAVIMSDNNGSFAGLWYPTDVKKYFLSIGQDMPDDYWNGYVDINYFKRTGFLKFELQEGKSAAEAIEAMLQGPTVLDCGNAMQLVYYKTLLDVLGKERFDRIFNSGSFRLKVTQIMDDDTPITYFLESTPAAKSTVNGTFGHRVLKIGDICYFMGVGLYPDKHPTGAGNGWNVVYIGDNPEGEQLFAGFGFDRPKTEHEINISLVELYNRDRTEEDEKYIEEMKKSPSFDENRNNFLRTNILPTSSVDERVGGFLVNICRRFNLEKVLKAKFDQI